jgi:hypothetical protein
MIILREDSHLKSSPLSKSGSPSQVALSELSATIIIPTHDHADTLYASVKSALLQTVQAIEVIIIGDGVQDVTRRIVRDLQSDSRVTFLDRPKSPRTGELYRHQALQNARGKIVCYLSDDDLYFPDHVEHMLRLLENADFVNALPLRHEGETLTINSVDLTQASNLSRVADGSIARFGLSFAAHTIDFYRTLPYGWRTTPAGTWTDQYMWRQCLSQPNCRAVSSFLPTVLGFPAPSRSTVEPPERLAELQRWLERLLDPFEREQIRSSCLQYAVKSAAQEVGELALVREQLQLWLDSHQTQEQLARNWEEGHRALEQRLTALESSPLLKARAKLLAAPLVAKIARAAGPILRRQSRSFIRFE